MILGWLLVSCQGVNVESAFFVVQIVHQRGKNLISPCPEQVVGDLTRRRAHDMEVRAVREVLLLYWPELVCSLLQNHEELSHKVPIHCENWLDGVAVSEPVERLRGRYGEPFTDM